MKNKFKAIEQRVRSCLFESEISGKRKVLRGIWVLSLFLSVIGWGILILFSSETTSMDENGILHEPLFWLIPLGYFSLCLAIIMIIADIILEILSRFKP